MSYVNPGELTSLKLVSGSVTGLRWIIMENPQPEQRPLVSNTHVHTNTHTKTHTQSQRARQREREEREREQSFNYSTLTSSNIFSEGASQGLPLGTLWGSL